MTITKKPAMPLHTLLLWKHTFGFSTANNTSSHNRKKIMLHASLVLQFVSASVLRSNAGRAMARHFSAEGRTFIWYDAAQRGGRWDTSLSQGWFSGCRSGGRTIPQVQTCSAVFLTNHLGQLFRGIPGVYSFSLSLLPSYVWINTTLAYKKP